MSKRIQIKPVFAISLSLLMGNVAGLYTAAKLSLNRLDDFPGYPIGDHLVLALIACGIGAVAGLIACAASRRGHETRILCGALIVSAGAIVVLCAHVMVSLARSSST